MNKIEFSSLTPKKDAELGIYKDALDFAFSNEEVKNIALSGAYGSGKSSIIETYKRNNNRKMLHISLAHFEQNDVTDEKLKEPDPSLLEWKILNQLVHQIPPEKIPQNNFQVKKNVSNSDIAWAATGIITFIILILYNLFFDKWITFFKTLNNQVTIKLLSILTATEFRVVGFIISAFLAVYGVYKIFVLQRNKKVVKQVDVKGTKIEMFSSNTESYFDKYLNEVLYLFENVEQEIIVFEDIDRFDCLTIFERLREINTLVNHSQKRKNKSILKFVYLIRDDIFINKDRIKFFDFIIPVVPIVDGSNSYNKLIDLFTKHGILEQFNRAFLQGFSLYIDEMRLLINICNEYLIYYSQIGKEDTEIDQNKLLAMIAYKNLFPHDFAELQLGRGFIYTLIENKNEMIKSQKEEFEEKLIEIKSKINNLNNEHLQSENEVDYIYKERLEKLLSSTTSYSKDIRDKAQKEIDEIEEIIKIRKECITNKTESKRIELENQIIKIEKEIVAVRSKRIKDCINNNKTFEELTYTNPTGILENFENVKNNKYFELLIFLIRNGQIDETYDDYMTYFYPNSLSTNDARFCRSITDQKAKPPEYLLDNPEIVLKSIPSEYFLQLEVLNYSLLDYLLVQKFKSDQLKLIIDQLKETKNYDFVRGYLFNGKEIGKFISLLNKNWNKIFNELYSSKEWDDEYLKKYSLNTIYFSNDDEIKNVNIDNCLMEYISSSTDYLNISEPVVERLIHKLKMIKVLFKTINEEKANIDLLKGVYENNLYDITFNNICIMLNKNYNVSNTIELFNKNYSIISKKPDSPLFKYVNNNIDNYIIEILNNCKENITDDEDKVIFILNNENISIEHKKKYISYLKTNLILFKSIIDSQFWQDLLKRGIINFSEENVIDYYRINNELENVLVEWINKQKSKVDFLNIQWKDDEEKSKLFRNVVKCELMNDDKYIQFVNSLKRIYTRFEFDNIKENKMRLLVNNNIIEFNQENFEFIRNNYLFDIKYQFIIMNLDEYYKLLDTKNELINKDEIEYLISKEAKIPEDKQIGILQLYSEELSIKDKDYSEAIQSHILSNNFSESDLDYLINNYDKYSTNVRKVIIKLIGERLDTIIESKYSISKNIYFDLLVNNIDKEKIKYILALSLTSIGENECIKYLSNHELNQFCDIFNKDKKPQFENTDLNRFILDRFIEWRKITEYSICENGKIYIKR